MGGGIAGIVLAHRLMARGVGVVLLEAGGTAIDATGQSLFAAAHLESTPHAGTQHGRFRVFGGTSLRWGGQLLPLMHDAWPVSAEELAPFSAQAEELLGVHSLPDALPDGLPANAAAFFASIGSEPPSLLAKLDGISQIVSKWTPFARRNLAETLGQQLRRHPRVQVVLHAQATELLLSSDGTRVEAVCVTTLRGETLRCEAAQFVVAAGTVETARLLLASRSVMPNGAGNGHDQVGRGFHDHLTLPAATLHGPARAMLLQQMRPWIVRSAAHGRIVHSLKLEAGRELRKRLGLNPVLAHLTLEEPEGSGLGAVRAMLRARQQHDGVRALSAHAAQLPQAAMEALRLAWEAQRHGRRYVSAKTQARLFLNCAQDAPSASRITLSAERDASGQPLPVVDWSVSPGEVATLRRFAQHLRQALEAAGCTGVAWAAELFDDAAPLLHLEDARHAMGGACMGHDPRSSVVDAQLRVHGISNLHIASAAVFPTGDAHLPTLPLMALTLRLAERLASL